MIKSIYKHQENGNEVQSEFQNFYSNQFKLVQNEMQKIRKEQLKLSSPSKKQAI